MAATPTTNRRPGRVQYRERRRLYWRGVRGSAEAIRAWVAQHQRDAGERSDALSTDGRHEGCADCGATAHTRQSPSKAFDLSMGSWPLTCATAWRSVSVGAIVIPAPAAETRRSELVARQRRIARPATTSECCEESCLSPIWGMTGAERGVHPVVIVRSLCGTACPTELRRTR